MFVDGVCLKLAPHLPHSKCESPPKVALNEVIDPNNTCDSNNRQLDKEWNQLTPNSSPQSSGYLSSVDEVINGSLEDKKKCKGQKTSTNVTESPIQVSDWDYEEFDPKNPYLTEPLTYPPEQELHLPINVSKLFYIPSKSLPKRIPRKRISRSPEIKAKISKRTGRPKRSSQFLQPDSPSEGSDTD